MHERTTSSYKEINMTQSERPNIYELLKKDIKVCEVVIDVGCAGEDGPLKDLVDFEHSFKKLIGIDKELKKEPLEYYKDRRFKNKTIKPEDWWNGSLERDFEKYDILEENFLNYNFKKKHYNLIICNKVLHFFEDEIKFEQINRFYESLQEDGLMYLKISHNQNLSHTDPSKMDKCGKNTFQCKEGERTKVHLVNADNFRHKLSEQYYLLDEYTIADNNRYLTTVIKKTN